jgi:hypothetical protein
MRKFDQAFLKLRSATVSERLGSLWLVVMGGGDLLNLEASWPQFGDSPVPIALGKERSRVKLHATFWKVLGPFGGGDFYVLMRGEEFVLPKIGKAT